MISAIILPTQDLFDPIRFDSQISSLFQASGLPHIKGFNFIGTNANKFPEYEQVSSGLIFVLVPGGEFKMGSPVDEPSRNLDEFEHLVKVSPFLISKYEVSQSIWNRIMGNNPSEVKGDNLPVENVSWMSCFGNEDSFCKRLGLSLPTEAQWEYACRAGTATPFSFGFKINLKKANFNGNYPYSGNQREPDSFHQSLPINSFKPNPFGIYNIHGNVWEWCLDVYNKNYYTMNQSKNGDFPCNEADDKKLRVLRGGGWSSEAKYCRSAFRDKF